MILHAADGDQILARLIGKSQRIESVQFSPDGKTLAVTGGTPAERGEVQIWDLATKTLKKSIPVTYDTLYGASWSPDENCWHLAAVTIRSASLRWKQEKKSCTRMPITTGYWILFFPRMAAI